MRSLPNAYLLARQLLAQTEAWLTLIEVELLDGQVARLAQSPLHVTAGGQIFQAASMEIEGLTEDDEGGLGALRITVSNISRLPMTWVEGLDAILGRPVTLYLVHESDVATLHADLSWTYDVLSMEADALAATFTAGHPATTALVPRTVYARAEFPGLLRVGPRS